METLAYFMRGLPLGDAVWFDESNNSGILYGDPLYSPVAVRLNPVNGTDTLSGVVDLFGSTVNGRDPAQVFTSYHVDVCPGDDFFTCDQLPGAWQPTGISGRGWGGIDNALLGTLDSAAMESGDNTLRLTVNSRHVATNRIQVLRDYYPVHVAADQDGDGIADTMDNCTLALNPDQRDTDLDGYGNACDADLNNDGIVDFSDSSLLKSVFMTAAPGIEPFVLADHADFNNSNYIDLNDFSILKGLFGAAAGPSCCGVSAP